MYTSASQGTGHAPRIELDVEGKDILDNETSVDQRNSQPRPTKSDARDQGRRRTTN
jgi:hypothetical protein